MVVIRRMREEERPAVEKLVVASMRSRYGCNAYPLPDLVLVAVRRRTIGGAIAISLRETEPLPLESIYEIDQTSLPAGFSWRESAQFGRWVALFPGIGPLLFLAAMRYAEKHGCRWGIGEMKPAVRRRLARLGLTTKRLAGVPILSRIPASVLPYYTSPPAPSLYGVVVRDAITFLEQYVAQVDWHAGVIFEHC